jgi:hypothetical protein
MNNSKTTEESNSTNSSKPMSRSKSSSKLPTRKTPVELQKTIYTNATDLYTSIKPVIINTGKLIRGIDDNNKNINNNIDEMIYSINQHITKINEKISENNSKHKELITNYIAIEPIAGTFYNMLKSSQSFSRQISSALTTPKRNGWVGEPNTEDFGLKGNYVMDFIGGRTRKHKSRRQNKRKSRKSKHYSRRLL